MKKIMLKIWFAVKEVIWHSYTFIFLILMKIVGCMVWSNDWSFSADFKAVLVLLFCIFLSASISIVSVLFLG